MNVSGEVRSAEKFSSWIRRGLAARGWSQSELATKAGINRSELNRILNDHRAAKPYEVECIVGALRLSREQLLQEVELPLETRKVLEFYASYERRIHDLEKELEMTRAQLMRVLMTPQRSGGCRIGRPRPHPSPASVSQPRGSDSPEVPESKDF